MKSNVVSLKERRAQARKPARRGLFSFVRSAVIVGAVLIGALVFLLWLDS